MGNVGKDPCQPPAELVDMSQVHILPSSVSPTVDSINSTTALGSAIMTFWRQSKPFAQCLLLRS